MEFRRATLDEQPDPWLVERHEREIFPLLHRRAWFAEAHDFLLYDFVTDGGAVDEDVLAYSNGPARRARWCVYHDRFASTAGTIRESVALRAQGGRAARSGWSAGRWPRGSALPDDPAMFVTFRDARTGLEYLRSCREHPRARAVAHARRLPGPRVLGVPRAGRRRRRPVAPARRAARRSRRAVARRRAARAPARAGPRAAPGAVRRRPRRGGARWHGRPPTISTSSRTALGALLAAVAEATGVTGDPVTTADAHPRARRRRPTPTGRSDLSREDRAALLGWLVLSRIGRARAAAPTSRPTSLRLVRRAAAGAGRRGRLPRRAGLDEAAAWARRRSRPRAAGPAAAVDDPRSRPAAPTCGSSRAGWRATPSGRRWASTPGRASSGSTATASLDLLRWAVRLDAHRGRARPGRRGPRRSPRGVRPRRPATGSTRCRRRSSRRPRSTPIRVMHVDIAREQPPEERRRRRAVSDDRLEVGAVAEAGRLAEAAGQRAGPDRDGSAPARRRGPPARLELDVPHLHRAGEVRRQLRRRQPRPLVLVARLGLLLEAAVDHQRDGLVLGHRRRSGSGRR